MATLVRDVERPSFLDPPAGGQLGLGLVAVPGREAPGREAVPAGEPLSGRLRAEADAGAGGAASVRADTTLGGEATLDELFVGAWEGLSARRPVTCPVCAGSMHPRAGAVGGACGDCGSRLR